MQDRRRYFDGELVGRTAWPLDHLHVDAPRSRRRLDELADLMAMATRRVLARAEDDDAALGSSESVLEQLFGGNWLGDLDLTGPVLPDASVSELRPTNARVALPAPQ